MAREAQRNHMITLSTGTPRTPRTPPPPPPPPPPPRLSLFLSTSWIHLRKRCLSRIDARQQPIRYKIRQRCSQEDLPKAFLTFMLFERTAADIQTSVSHATWLSSFASFLTDNPTALTALTCLFFLGTIVYRFSPPLSPRTQLVQLKNSLDEIVGPDDKSSDILPIHRPRDTRKSLKLMQIETCKIERSLLYTAVNRSSWGEYLRSLKEVYMRARACCKRIQAIKPFIAIADTEARQKCLEEELAKEERPEITREDLDENRQAIPHDVV
ncbi:hypothetical protein ARMGADRAFT_41652 [Armillaria gallica]|uniref:Uncharacterized protein n=1 Tax=Armillaria gallica TaxID=47427 RepID=A0A2H3EXC6_ARMGA|nr:hypothetical protein ARMGADRAFT_41652 [Armillaria gallica]